MNPIDSRCVANTIIKYFLDRSDTIRNMKLQKLLYFFCGYEYAIQDKWLIDSDFEAWPYGPVCPPVYYNVSNYGYRPINAIISNYSSLYEKKFLKNKEMKSIFNTVMEKFGSYHDWVLSMETHKLDSPWLKTIHSGKIGDSINKEIIKNHFILRLKS